MDDITWVSLTSVVGTLQSVAGEFEKIRILAYVERLRIVIIGSLASTSVIYVSIGFDRIFAPR